MAEKAKIAKGDIVTAKGRGRTKFTVIHPTRGAVLVSSGGKGTDQPYATTYINADDLKASSAKVEDPEE